MDSVPAKNQSSLPTVLLYCPILPKEKQNYRRCPLDITTVIIHRIKPHCKENSIYVFLFWKLRGLRPNFRIHVSVNDLYIPRIGPQIWLQQNRHTILEIHKSLTDVCVQKLGDRTLLFCFGNKMAAQFHFWEYINGNQTFIPTLAGCSSTGYSGIGERSAH